MVIELKVLVTSERDIASQTIRQVLIEEHGFEETGQSFEGSPVFSLADRALLIHTTRDMIECEHLEASFHPEAFVFCSRHRAQSGQPALLVHSTGNLGNDSSFGGQPMTLSVSAPSLVGVALRRLKEQHERLGLTEFDVTLEVTHHGPTSLSSPLVFIELGSDEHYWRHIKGARAVADAAVACIDTPVRGECAIAFGGTHYASKFNEIVLRGDYEIGHIAPKYVLDSITPAVIQQMVQRSASRVSVALVDWKGTNARQREIILPVLRQLGLEIVRAN